MNIQIFLTKKEIGRLNVNGEIICKEMDKLALDIFPKETESNELMTVTIITDDVIVLNELGRKFPHRHPTVKNDMRWTPSHEGLPNIGEPVLAMFIDAYHAETIDICKINHVIKTEINETPTWYDSNFNIVEPSHWIPLPQKP